MSDASYLESRRMRLRGIVHVASEVLPLFWPMRTFVHHNPLHGLEDLPFHEAVQQGERLFGGRGYLTGDAYRDYLRAGRIRPAHLDTALLDVASEGVVTVGGRQIGHREVLLACMTHGIGEPGETEKVDALPGRGMTLAAWCDRELGTDIVARVNDELVKWCDAFLDEGHATWPMPGRKHGFYLAWRFLASKEWRSCGIVGSRKSIQALPVIPDDALLESLARLGVPDDLHQAYLELELAALPGWAGYIRWRSERREHPWQQAYPVSLVKYLAVRLWYERELVAKACRTKLGIEGNLDAVLAYVKDRPRDAGAAGASVTDSPEAAERMSALAAALDLPLSTLRDAGPDTLAALARWSETFTPSARGAVWQRAFEAGYQEDLLRVLDRGREPAGLAGEPPIRPLSQSVYCLDVRTEPFRRHLEETGDHETFAFGGFFGASIRFRGWGREDYVDQVPAVMQPRNEVREIPRSYHEHLVPTYRRRARWLSALDALLRDLKENVATPFVMVESLGWFYGVPLVGKTLAPTVFQRLSDWIGARVLPPVPTSLTVDKLTPAEIEAMLSSEQRDVIWKALRDRFGRRGVGLAPRFVEAIRLHAFSTEMVLPDVLAMEAEAIGLSTSELDGLVEALRQESQFQVRAAGRRKERLTRAGFTVDEQVATVEMFLKTMGLTGNFARLVLICAHGSTSENNPYESALDCGACGGNAGMPNARTVAFMANNPKVRERLVGLGIAVPSDTHFLAGQLDTTRDLVQLFDLEDVAPTHRKDVARLQEDLARAGQQTSAERLARLPDIIDARRPSQQVWQRSADWSQVRPEWGLSGNAAFIIAPRGFTKGLDLDGRVFMHSYEPREDPSGRLLEVILLGPQLVAQWISMEHYFSTTDAEVYGSGSKVYHNVAGRVGVMSGPSSDLRMGLARQTVMSGDRPYHEPMRLTTIIAARRSTLDALVARHGLLQNYYQREWVHLIAWDPDDSRLYRYEPTGGWSRATSIATPFSLGKEPIA